MHIPRFLAVSLAAAFFLTLLLAGPAWAQNLSVEKDDNPDPVDRGDLLRYTVKVTNDGQDELSNANNVEVIDNLPLARVDFESVDADEFRCSFTGGPIRCELRGGETLAPDETERIEIVVRAEEAGTIQNTATVRAGGDINDTVKESTRVEAPNNNGGSGGGGGGGGTGDGTSDGTGTTDTSDTTGTNTTNTNTASPAAEVTTADANLNAAANRPDSGSFRCELSLRTVRDDTGALRAQYQGNEQIVQRFEQCLSEDVLAATIPDRNLPFTGGPSLPVGGGVLLLVAAALLAGRIIRR